MNCVPLRPTRCVSAGRSAVLEVARARARERAANPKWYADASRVKMIVGRAKAMVLLAYFRTGKKFTPILDAFETGRSPSEIKGSKPFDTEI